MTGPCRTTPKTRAYPSRGTLGCLWRGLSFSLGRAGLKTCPQLGLVKIAANKNQPAMALIGGIPRALEVAL